MKPGDNLLHKMLEFEEPLLSKQPPPPIPHRGKQLPTGSKGIIVNLTRGRVIVENNRI